MNDQGFEFTGHHRHVCWSCLVHFKETGEWPVKASLADDEIKDSIEKNAEVLNRLGES
jgi:hypothetical protein